MSWVPLLTLTQSGPSAVRRSNTSYPSSGLPPVSGGGLNATSMSSSVLNSARGGAICPGGDAGPVLAASAAVQGLWNPAVRERARTTNGDSGCRP